MWKASRFRYTVMHGLLVMLTVFFMTGCVTDRDLRGVVGENVVFTSAIVVQTVIAGIFNNLFGLFGLA